jgi:hypothetical protein
MHRLRHSSSAIGLSQSFYHSVHAAACLLIRTACLPACSFVLLACLLIRTAFLPAHSYCLPASCWTPDDIVLIDGGDDEAAAAQGNQSDLTYQHNHSSRLIILCSQTAMYKSNSHTYILYIHPTTNLLLYILLIEPYSQGCLTSSCICMQQPVGSVISR